MSEGIIIGEDNTEVWTWSEAVQHEKDDSLLSGEGAWKTKYEAVQRTIQNQSWSISKVRNIASYVQTLSREATTLQKQPNI